VVAYPITSTLTPSDHWDHILARVGWRRSQRRVEPGLYALGHPGPDAPVFVTANYRLSFDALRAALAGLDGYILVLDTDGINVWCAAGKGTFGTDELVHRIEVSGLKQVVSQRTLILPQLGAAGVAAHEVRRHSGFRVEYGPVRAADLPEYLKTHSATAEMRHVRFDLRDRLVLIPVEVVQVALPMLAVALAFYLAHGVLAALAVVMAFLAGTALFPILLPWLPTRAFSTKGSIVGGAVALAFALAEWFAQPAAAWWVRGGWGLAYLLTFVPLTAYLSLNFTGSTPFTSRSGVKYEIATYFPIMVASCGLGVVLSLALTLVRFLGG
jgi:hypothetical protein